MNTVNEFFGSIYKWMAAGVLVSALFAWLTMNTGLVTVLNNQTLFYGIVALEFILLIGIQMLINKLPYQVSFVLFFVYAALTGVTLSGLLWHFLSVNPMMVVIVFISAVTLFAMLALLGYTTKVNLSGWGTFLAASTWGIVIASLLNAIFIGSFGFHMIVTAGAMIIFSALTVYDAQYYKNLFPQLQTDEEKAKASTLGALHMYLNLIVMFQSLLQLVGFFGGD